MEKRDTRGAARTPAQACARMKFLRAQLLMSSLIDERGNATFPSGSDIGKPSIRRSGVVRWRDGGRKGGVTGE